MIRADRVAWWRYKANFVINVLAPAARAAGRKIGDIPAESWLFLLHCEYGGLISRRRFKAWLKGAYKTA